MMTKCLLSLLFCLAISTGVARADVSLFIHEALGISGEASSAGHASIYFSNVCAESPVKLRLCRPGETGIVIALYPDFGANKPYEWIAIPLTPFLYGVEDERELPLYVNGEVRTLLREKYRRAHLRSIIADMADGSLPRGGWQQMIGATFNRDTYSLTLTTTPDEDAVLIEKLNSKPNINRFDAVFYNCADFVREVINIYFQGAARRDPLNDFFMTSPKAVSRSLSRYAAKRPERLFYITRYGQLSGPIRRSLDNRNYSEWAILSKKYLIPQVLFQRYMLAFFAVSYFTVGRFNIHQQYVEYPTLELAQLKLEESMLKDRRLIETGNGNISADITGGINGGPGGTDGAVDTLARRSEIISKKEAERARVFGTMQSWKKYREAFAPMLQKAIADGLFADAKEVKTFFKDLELQSEPAFDKRGALILRVKAYGEDQVLGLTRDNILNDQSNPQLAYKLMLAKVNAALNAKEKNRESMETFEADWNLMLLLSDRSAATFKPMASRPGRFRVMKEKVPFGERVKKVFVIVTH